MMKFWLISSIFLAAACQLVAGQASCTFENDVYYGYQCILTNAVVTQENTNLVINTGSHQGGLVDADVHFLTVHSSSNLAFFPNSIIQQFPNLRVLHLENSGLTALTPGAFNGGNNLVIIQIRGTPLQRIPAGVFSNLPSLALIDLVNNDITEIENGAFAGLTDLLEIFLNENRIGRIPSGAFQGLTNLEDLYLAQNEISEIEDGAFSDLSSLIILYLRNNRITEIRPEMFGTSAPTLVNFNLNDNFLTQVPRLPDNTPALRFIYLNGNQIQEINDDSFGPAYTGATNIELMRNGIRRLSAIPFEHMTNLDTLRVSENSITSLDDEFFTRLPLFTFYFEHNSCADVRYENVRAPGVAETLETVFDRCHYHFVEPAVTHECYYQMDEPYGYGCSLNGIQFQNFRHKFNVSGEHILDFNNLDVQVVRIENSNFARVPPSIFTTLFPNARTFILTNSNLEVVDRHTFEQCGYVYRVDLSGNRIRKLPSDAFYNCNSIRYLTLDDNLITEIQPCYMFVSNTYTAVHISMRNNICVDRELGSPYEDNYLIYDIENNINRHLSRCYGMWYQFLDN